MINEKDVKHFEVCAVYACHSLSLSAADQLVRLLETSHVPLHERCRFRSISVTCCGLRLGGHLLRHNWLKAVPAQNRNDHSA